jgi:CubicO group peptidase (beta-lactamase class C family)
MAPITLRRRLLLTVASLSLVAAACSEDASSEGAVTTSTTVGAEATTVAEVESSEGAEESPADAFAEITQAVEAFVDAEGLEGAGLVIVERDAGVVYQEQFGAFGPDRISMIASSSKMISAGVLLKLQEEGLLDIDAPVEGQVDWAVGNPDITTAQLLSNSSGLVGLGPNLLYGPYLCQWGVPNTLQECGETVFTTADDDADQIPPDTEFRYGGAQWQVAGAVAESVSGKSWDQLIDEIYVEPCGVDSLGYVSLGAVLTGAPGYPVAFGGDPSSVTPSENPSIEGGAHITTGDYAKLLLMHLRGGACDSTQVLSQESLDTMHADRIAAVYDGDSSVPGAGYGMGWWVDRETGQISDGGAYGSVPWLDLEDGYGAYLVVEADSGVGNRLAQLLNPVVEAAMTAGA